MAKQPTEQAMRAAKAIRDFPYRDHDWPMEIATIAEIIDEETGLPVLLEQIDSLTALRDKMRGGRG